MALRREKKGEKLEKRRETSVSFAFLAPLLCSAATSRECAGHAAVYFRFPSRCHSLFKLIHSLRRTGEKGDGADAVIMMMAAAKVSLLLLDLLLSRTLRLLPPRFMLDPDAIPRQRPGPARNCDARLPHLDAGLHYRLGPRTGCS